MSASIAWGGVAFAAGDATPPLPPATTSPAPDTPLPTWMEAVCQEGSKASCLAAYGWHWLRKTKFVVDPALKTMKYAAMTYTTAIIARAVYGSSDALEYVITLASGGVRSGFVLLAGGFVVATIGTVASAAGFLLSMTTPAGNAHDNGEALTCKGLLDQYKTPQGIIKFRNLPEDEFRALLPCIPYDPEMRKFLTDGMRNGMSLEKQVQQQQP